MATPGMDFGGGGRGGLNMMLAGGLPGGGSIQDLIAQLQGRLGGGGDLRSPMRGGPAPPPMIAQPVGPPRRFGPPGQVGGQGVPVIAFKGRPGGGDQDSNQMPTPDRPPSPGRGMLPYKEPPAPEPQEAAPQGAPEVPGGTDDDFRRIAAPQGAPGGPRQAPPRAAPPRPQLAQKPAEVPGGPQTNLPPGIREASISAQKPARKPAGGGNQLSTKPAEVPGWQQAGFDSRREAAQAAKAAGHEGSLRSFVQSQLGGGGGGPQLAPKPAQKPTGEGGAGLGSFAPGNMPKFPGYQPPPDVSGVNLPPGYKKINNGIYDPSGALVYGSGGSFVDPEGGGATRDLRTINELPEALGGGNQLATKPAQLPQWVRDREVTSYPAQVPGGIVQSTLGAMPSGGLVQMTPEKLWAIQNAPPWAQKMGAGADEVLRFIRNNPDSPIAQKYAAAGLG